MPRLVLIALPIMLMTAGCQPRPVMQGQLDIAGAHKEISAVNSHSRIPLISVQYVTSVNERLVIPFNANDIVVPPRLHLSFVVKSRGHCHVTYEGTEISLNDRLIKALDFRDFEDDQEVAIDLNLPIEFLRDGANEVRIAMGSCDYDVDAMQINQTHLIF